jgi:hypothetical protein
MNTTIFLICVSNLVFGFLGFLAGYKVRIIQINKGDSLLVHEMYKEEEAVVPGDETYERKETLK